MSSDHCYCRYISYAIHIESNSRDLTKAMEKARKSHGMLQKLLESSAKSENEGDNLGTIETDIRKFQHTLNELDVSHPVYGNSQTSKLERDKDFERKDSNRTTEDDFLKRGQDV